MIVSAQTLDVGGTHYRVTYESGVVTDVLLVGGGQTVEGLLAWLGKGNTPDPYVPPPEPPVLSKDEAIDAKLAAIGISIDDLKARLASPQK